MCPAHPGPGAGFEREAVAVQDRLNGEHEGHAHRRWSDLLHEDRLNYREGGELPDKYNARPSDDESRPATVLAAYVSMSDPTMVNAESVASKSARWNF